MRYLFENFELDVEGFTLSKDGGRIALEPKSLQVLVLLIESRGKLLEKSVILDRVWEGISVEESNLTRSITLIRKQLGDGPRNPRFIETVPTRGYRFIATVTEARPAPPTPPALAPAAAPPPREPYNYPAQWPRFGRALWLILAGVLTLLVGLTTAVWFHTRRAAEVRPEDTIVLADFTNTTGDPALEDTLRQGLAIQLEQSPLLRLLPDPKMRATLSLMGLPGRTPVISKIGNEICQRTGSRVLLSGSIARNGDRFVLGIEATGCTSGEVILRAQDQVARKEDLLDATGKMAARLRERMGETKQSIRDLNQPLAEATTPSLEALKVYSIAFRTLSLEGSAAALPLFRRATEIDPDFALAHSEMGRIYADIGEDELSLKSAATAYRLRARSSLRERFFIDATYQLQVLGNAEKAEETCRSWQQLYPLDPGGPGFLSGIILRIFGRYDEAVPYAQRTIETNPSFGMGYHILAINQIRLNKLAEAEETLRKAAARGLTMPEFQMDAYRIAFLKGDDAGMERAAASAKAHGGTEAMVLNQMASTLAFHGHLREADSFSDRAVDLAKQSGKDGLAAEFEAAAALRSAFWGDAAQARKRARMVMTLSRSKDAEYGAAFAYALIGDGHPARAIAEDLAARFPEDTVVRYQYVPSIMGLEAIDRGEPQRTLDLLAETKQYELGFPQNAAVGTFGALYIIYVRGLAYTRLHRKEDAERAFEQIVSHPGITSNDPIGVMARRQLSGL